MRKNNQNLKWLLLVLPLVGCASTAPVETTSKTETTELKASVAPATPKRNPIFGFFNSASEVKVEKADTSPDATFKAVDQNENIGINPKLSNSRPVNVDPNVKLISPPTSIPKTTYVVPEVDEKETYVPPVVVAKCVKAKHGKKHCKHVSDSKHEEKSAVKGKHGSHAVEKSSKKGAKEDHSIEKNSHKTAKKKDGKKADHKK